MKIAFITSEAYPYAKTGGLADVSFSLPRALHKRGHDVRIIMPRYYAVDKKRFNLRLIHAPLCVPLGLTERWAAIYEAYDTIITYFIEHDNYFGRDSLYGYGDTPFEDNAERFAFFARAVFPCLEAMEFEPDIIHCNDWQTALVPVFRKTHYASDPFFANAAVIITVHNVGYQGVFHKDNFIWTELGWDLFTAEGLEYFDQINYLKGGILFSDTVTTVSRKYALEIQSEEYGYNLAPLFRKIKKRLYGITNGVDYGKWNPHADTLIPQQFTGDDLSGKRKCKAALQKRMGLPVNRKTPILASISRLTHQKGMDLLAETLELLSADDRFQFMILGSGEEWLIEKFEELRSRFPTVFGIYWGYDESLAHLIEAGADIFIMPSRYEPCGLNQMYSMKYGTIPVVRATGGLDDTVIPWNPENGTGTGFKFTELSVRTLYGTIREVLRKYRNQKEWKILQQNAMIFNRSWHDAAEEYEAVYRLALKGG